MSKESYLEVHLFISVCRRLQALINSKQDKQLQPLTNHLDNSLTYISLILLYEVDMETGKEMVKELRKGLADFPELIKSTVPGYGEILIVEFETSIGYRFNSFSDANVLVD